MSYKPDYLYFFAEDGPMTIDFSKTGTSSSPLIIEYSTDKITWTSLTLTTPSDASLAHIFLVANTPVFLRGNNTTINENGVSLNLRFVTSDASSPTYNIWSGGSINTLLSYTEDINTIPPYCFQKLFYNNTCLRSAPKLPASAVQSYGYLMMFASCGIYKAPELPATSLSDGCYSSMFYGCNNLIVAPYLPATSVPASGYRQMFSDCQNLKIPAAMRAYTVYTYGCESMYYNCYNLRLLPNLNFNAYSYACQYMFVNCYVLTINTSSSTSVSKSFVTPTGSGYHPLRNMFGGTRGSRPETPVSGATYYTTYRSRPYSDPDWLYIQNVGTTSDRLALRVTGHNSSNVEFSVTKNYNTEDSWITITDNGDYDLGTLAANDVLFIHGSALNPNFACTTQFIINSGDSSPIIVGGNLRYYWNTTNLPAYAAYQLFMDCALLKLAPTISHLNGTCCCMETFKNCSGLVQAPIFSNYTTTISATTTCKKMFENCSNLVMAHDLPYTTIGHYAYDSMFKDCSSLKFAPELYATTTGFSPYVAMFQNCTSLLYPPSELLPTTFPYAGYNAMFYGCSSLLDVPLIYATDVTSLDDNPCFNMYYGCSHLTVLNELPSLRLSTRIYEQMYQGCTQIKLSQVRDGIYQTEYRIPSYGTATQSYNSSTNNMFLNTGGTFQGSPVVNTTYYTCNTVKGVLNITDEKTDDNIGQCIHRTIISSNIPINYSVTARAVYNGTTESLPLSSHQAGTTVNFINSYPTNANYSIYYDISDENGQFVRTIGPINDIISKPNEPTLSATVGAFVINAATSAPTLTGNYKILLTCRSVEDPTEIQSHEYNWNSQITHQFTGLQPGAEYVIDYDVYDSNLTISQAFWSGTLSSIRTNEIATLGYTMSTCHTGTFRAIFDSSITDTCEAVFELYLDNTRKDQSIRITAIDQTATWTTNKCMPQTIGSSHTYYVDVTLYVNGISWGTKSIDYTPQTYTLLVDTPTVVGRQVTLNFTQNAEQEHMITLIGDISQTITAAVGEINPTATATLTRYLANYNANATVTYDGYTIANVSPINFTTGAAGTIQHSSYQNRISVWTTNLASTAGVYPAYIKYRWQRQSESNIDESDYITIDSTAAQPGLYSITNLIPESSYTVYWTFYDSNYVSIQDEQSASMATGAFVISTFAITAKNYTTLTTYMAYTAEDDNFEIDYYVDGTLTESHTITSRSSETYTHTGFITNTQHSIQAKVYYTYGGIRYLVETSITAIDTTKAAVNWINDRRSSKISFYTNVASYYAAVSTAVWTFNGVEYPAVTLDPTDTRIGYIEFTGLTPETTYQYSIQYFSTGGLYIGSDSGSISTTSISADFAQLLPRQSYNSVIVQISNIDYDVSGLYVKYRLNSTYSEAITVVDNAAEPYTFTGLTGGNTYAIHAYVYTDQACTHQVGHLESTAQTGHAAEVSYSATSNSAQLWMIPTNLQVASGYAAWTIGATTHGEDFINTEATPGRVEFTGLSRNTQYNYTLRIYTEQDGTLLDTITGSFRTLNYVGSINGTVDFNSIYLLLSGINFDITGMTLIYHCGSNVYSEQQTSSTPAGHNFTGLAYATGYDCWAEVIDNTTSIMDTSHKTYATTQPITYTFIPQNQSVISSITGHNNPVATVEWSITNGVTTITQTQNALSTVTISGLIPNEYYTYTGQCYTAGHVAEGNPITGSFRTKSISGILQATLVTNESATLSVSGLNIIETGTYTVKYSCNSVDTTYTFTNNGIPAHAVSGLSGNTSYPISATIYNGTTQLAQFTGTFTTDRDWKVTLANNSPHDIAITPTYYPARYANYYYQVVFYYNNGQIGQTLRTLFTTNTSVANLVPKISGNFKYSAYVYDAAIGGTLIDSIENVTYTPQAYTIRFTAQDSEYVSFKIGGFPANYIQTLNLTIKKSGATVKTETVNVAAADTQVIKTYNDLLYGTYTVQYSVVWEGYTVASGSSTYKSTVLPITYTNRATDDTITATVNSMTSQATRVTITVDGETKTLTEPGSAVFNELTASTTYPIIYRIYNNNTLLETLNLSIRTAANGGYINVSNIDYDAADVILINPKLAHSENMEGYTITYRGIGSPVTVPIDYITRGQKQHYSGLTANRGYHVYADLKYNNNLVSTFDVEFTTATLYTLTTDSTSTTATAQFSSMPYTHDIVISATLNGVTKSWTRNRGDYTESFTPVWTGLTRNTDYTLTYTITVDDTVVETGSRTIHTELYDYKLVQEWENTQLKIAVNDLTANTSSSVVFTVTATDFSFTQTVVTPQTYTGWVLPHQGRETTEAGIYYNISVAITENGTTYTLTDAAYLASPYDIKIEQKNQAISTRISGLYTDLTGYSMDMTIKSADNTTTLDYIEYEIPANTYDTGDIYNHADVSLIPKTYYIVEVHLYHNGYLIAEKTQTICFAFEYEVDASYNDNNRLYVELNWYRPYAGYYVTANVSDGATQVQLLSYSNRGTLIFDSLDTTIDQTLNLAFYDQYNTLLAQESKRIRAKSENVDITVEAVDDNGNIQFYASPVPSDVSQITWIISAGDAIVYQKIRSITSTDHQSSPIEEWQAVSNTEYLIKCVMSNGQIYTKHYTTPLFGYGMNDVEFDLYTFATQIGFSMYNASTDLTYDYGAYLEGRLIGSLIPFTVDDGGGAYYKVVNGLLPSTSYDLVIHCYNQGLLVYTYTLPVSTNARGRVYAQWSGNYALVYLDDMNQETGSVTYHSENQTSAQISFSNIDMGAQASLTLDPEKSHTIYADVTFTTNGITYHDTFTTELKPLITYNVRARLDLENSRYPILQVWNEYDTDTHTILADVKLRCASDNRLTWQFSRTLTNYDEFKSDTALYPDDYILSYRIYEGNTTLLQDDIRFSAGDQYEQEYLDAEGYETSIYAKLKYLQYNKTYNITYRLVGENVNRVLGPYNVSQCYTTEPVIFTNITEEGNYVLYVEYYISGDSTLHVLSTQVIWNQSNSIYGNDELKIIPHAVSEDDLVVEATGSFIDDYTDYNLKWSLYDAGLQVKSAEQNYDVAMPHPYSVFNDLPLDKRYDIVLDYTGNDGAIQRRRKSYMYFGSLGHFEYFEINQCLYITYIGPTDAYATVLLTNPKRKPLTATINDGMTYQLQGIQPNTTYTVKAVINSDTTHQKLGEINETYTTLNYLRLTAQTGQSETSVVATVTNIRQGFAPCYIKFTIRKSGSTGTAAIDEYQESSLIYTTYSTLPSYTFSNLNAGTTYDIRAELYINQDFYGYESILYKTASAAPAAWTWLTNNGSWTVGRLGRETYTVDSKSALDGTGDNRRVCLFHSEVWNDMCEKVRDMLWYLGETWDNEYLPYDETIMTNTWGYILTAQRYRSLWTQVINHINTPGIHHDILARGCNVYATYITDLMQFVNDWISSGVSSFYSQEYDPLAQILARWKSGSTLTQTEIDINTQRNTSIDLGLVRGRKFETAEALTTWLNFKRA